MSSRDLPEKKESRAGAAVDKKSKQQIDGNGRAAQRQRLLEWLRRRPITTFAARSELDVHHPAARILELRARGFCIITHWATATSSAGTPHRVAKYALLGEPKEAR